MVLHVPGTTPDDCVYHVNNVNICWYFFFFLPARQWNTDANADSELFTQHFPGDHPAKANSGSDASFAYIFSV